MKYLKDTLLYYYVYKSGGRDKYGVALPATFTNVGKIWANFKGVDYSEEYAARASWDKPIFKATFTLPQRFEVALGDYLQYRGKLYKIMSIDYLTGQPGHDIKVTCQYDPSAKLS